MENPRHVEVVRELYDAFSNADPPALLRCLTDDVEFVLPEMPGVPLETSYRGKEGVTRFLADREPAIRYTRFEPRTFLSDQNTVVVLGETGGVVVPTGTAFDYRWVQLFEFGPEDRIRRFHEFLDTNVLVSAFAAGRAS